MPIRAVTLDWGDTLAANHGMPYSLVHNRALRKLVADLTATGAPVPDEAEARWSEDLNQCWVETIDPNRNPEHHEFDYAALIRGWVHQAGCSPAQPAVAAAVAAYGDAITDTVVAFDGVDEALAALRARGLRIGILSHVPWPGDACRRWYARRGWEDRIDFWSLSCEVGVIKPNQRHYEHALAAAGCAAHELLHVGDHPLRDVEGGRRFGFRTVLKATEGVYDPDDLAACEPDAVIAHVRELPAVIDRLDAEEG